MAWRNALTAWRVNKHDGIVLGANIGVTSVSLTCPGLGTHGVKHVIVLYVLKNFLHHWNDVL